MSFLKTSALTAEGMAWDCILAMEDIQEDSLFIINPVAYLAQNYRPERLFKLPPIVTYDISKLHTGGEGGGRVCTPLIGMKGYRTIEFHIKSNFKYFGFTSFYTIQVTNGRNFFY